MSQYWNILRKSLLSWSSIVNICFGGVILDHLKAMCKNSHMLHGNISKIYVCHHAVDTLSNGPPPKSLSNLIPSTYRSSKQNLSFNSFSSLEQSSFQGMQMKKFNFPLLINKYCRFLYNIALNCATNFWAIHSIGLFLNTICRWWGWRWHASLLPRKIN